MPDVSCWWLCWDVTHLRLEHMQSNPNKVWTLTSDDTWTWFTGSIKLCTITSTLSHWSVMPEHDSSLGKCWEICFSRIVPAGQKNYSNAKTCACGAHVSHIWLIRYFPPQTKLSPHMQHSEWLCAGSIYVHLIDLMNFLTNTFLSTFCSKLTAAGLKVTLTVAAVSPSIRQPGDNQKKSVCIKYHDVDWKRGSH